MSKRNTPNTFWQTVEKTDGCWVWLGHRHVKGYGMLSFEGRRVRAHRLAWEFTHGPVPPGLIVCHRCDNPPCVRPDHLFVGTAADNMRDKHAKGRERVLRGESVGTSRLTADQVTRIRLGASAEPRRWLLCKRLAHEFHVSPSTILCVLAGKTWTGGIR